MALQRCTYHFDTLEIAEFSVKQEILDENMKCLVSLDSYLKNKSDGENRTKNVN